MILKFLEEVRRGLTLQFILQSQTLMENRKRVGYKGVQG